MPVFSIGGAVFVCTDLGPCSIVDLGTKDHHLLTGLSDDDHTIYYNATRHTKAVHDALGLDHGSLSGKGDYDHDQYLRKNGTQAMTGDLDLNSNALRNASEIEFSTDYAFTPLNGFLQLVNKANDAFKDLRVGILDIQGGIDMNQKQLIDLPTPTLDHQAATKKYHDDNTPAAFVCSDLSSCSIASLGTKDHHLLTGLGDDDHTQYLLINGTRAMTGDLNIGTHKITNLVDPTANQEAATKKYVDDNLFSCADIWGCPHDYLGGLGDDDHTQYLLVNGTRAMTGNLELTGNRYVKATGELYLDAGAGQEIWALKHFAPASDNALSFGASNYRWSAMYAVLGHFYGTLDMHSQKITNVLDPTANQEAATKKYVDDNLFSCADIWGCPHDYLGGLGDDDHTQYYNATRHTKTIHDALGLDHGSLSGKADYDHDQYLRKNGSQAMTGNLDMNSYVIQNALCEDFVPDTDDFFLLGTINYRWSDLYAVVVHEGDVAFAEKECIKCNKKFKVGDNIVYKVIKIDEETAEPMAIPIHLECANSPPKKVKKSYAIEEDYYVWDEEKGEAIKRKRNKTVTKKVKKRKIKEGNFEFDDKKGEFWKLKKGEEEGIMLRDKKVSVNDATEEMEEELKEVVYEDKEFLI